MASSLASPDGVKKDGGILGASGNQKLSFRDKLFFFGILFAQILLYLSNDMYLGGVTAIQKSLGITEWHITMSMSAWFAGSSSFPLIVAAISRYIHKRYLLIFGVCLFIVGNVLGANVVGFKTLLLSRFLQGACVSFIVVMGYAVIHENFAGMVVVSVMSVMNSISIVAPALGPIFGAFVSSWFGWRWIFWIISFASCAALWVIVRTTAGVKNVHAKPAEGGLLGVAKDYLRILSNRRFVRFGAIYCLLFFAVLYWILAAPLLIVLHAGKSEFVFGFVQALTCLGFPAGGILTNRLIKKGFCANKLVKTGLTLHLTGACMICCCYFFGFNLALVAAAVAVFIVGNNVAVSSLNRAAIEAEKGLVSQSAALLSNANGLFGFLSGVLLSVLIPFGFIGFAAVAFGAAALSFLVYFSGEAVSLRS